LDLRKSPTTYGVTCSASAPRPNSVADVTPATTPETNLRAPLQADLDTRPDTVQADLPNLPPKFRNQLALLHQQLQAAPLLQDREDLPTHADAKQEPTTNVPPAHREPKESVETLVFLDLTVLMEFLERTLKMFHQNTKTLLPASTAHKAQLDLPDHLESQVVAATRGLMDKQACPDVMDSQAILVNKARPGQWARKDHKAIRVKKETTEFIRLADLDRKAPEDCAESAVLKVTKERLGLKELKDLKDQPVEQESKAELVLPAMVARKVKLADLAATPSTAHAHRSPTAEAEAMEESMEERTEAVIVNVVLREAILLSISIISFCNWNDWK